MHLLIDTTGQGLHKRGYRPQANDAPLKETLAAAMCKLSRLRPYHTLYDPMCGSGTILIEGAMLVHNIPVGANRNFSAERFEQLNPNIWDEERERAKSLIITESDFKAIGSDIDKGALEIARQNELADLQQQQEWQAEENAKDRAQTAADADRAYQQQIQQFQPVQQTVQQTAPQAQPVVQQQTQPVTQATPVQQSAPQQVFQTPPAEFDPFA